MIPFRCVDLGCRFGRTTVLSGVGLVVGPGEFVAVMGGNAAGKTTLLNVASGLSLATTGRVEVYGRDVTRLSPRARARAGLVRSLENGGIWRHLDPIDHVAVGLSGRLSGRRRRAAEWVRRFGLEAWAGVPAGELSLGQQRRVEMARFLAHVADRASPSVLLLDEPFRGLDEEGSRILEGLLRDTVVGKIPTLVVEHRRDVVERLGARVVWLDAGRVSGPPPSAAASPTPAPPVGGEVVVRLRGVRAGYGPVEVLHGVNVEVRAGEAVQIVGGNGSGKSTLVRVLMGLVRPTTGSLELFGRVPGVAAGRGANGVGYAPQGGQLIPTFTVGEHLRFAESVARRAGRPPRFGPRLRSWFPEIDAFVCVPVARLSGGQRSLSAVAVAVATEPNLLVADEPAAGLSPEWAARLFRFLTEEWHGAGRTIVYVEHEKSAVPARIIRLARGAVVQ